MPEDFDGHVAPKHDPTLPYRSGPEQPWTDVTQDASTKTGRCPRCHGLVVIEIDPVEMAASPSKQSNSKSTVICKCYGGHEGHPDKLDGCGAYWFDVEVP